MKIKRLILGSAAAMVAVSGAQAADAIIVEPEPMEYVKVCDMYGAGYFYIPGTETCLKIGGYVRIDYNSDRYHEDEYNGISNHSTAVRAHVNFFAKNETEYGTLSSTIMGRFGWATEANRADDDYPHDTFSYNEAHGNGASLRKATISLAGFRAGFDGNSAGGWNRYTGSGYYNSINDGYYSFQTAIFLEYGGSAGGVNYVVGIQDADESGSSGQPDLYAAMNTTFSGLTLAAAVVYDSNGGYDEDLAGDRGTYDGGFAYRVRADYDMSSFIAGGKIGAWWEADNGETDYVKGHKWGVTMKANLTDKLIAYGGYSEQDIEEDAFNPANTRPADSRHWTVGLQWNVVSGLYMRAEWNKQQCTEDNCTFITGDEVDSRDRFTFRIQRSF